MTIGSVKCLDIILLYAMSVWRSHEYPCLQRNATVVTTNITPLLISVLEVDCSSGRRSDEIIVRRGDRYPPWHSVSTWPTRFQHYKLFYTPQNDLWCYWVVAMVVHVQCQNVVK